MRKFSLFALLLASFWSCDSSKAPSAEAYMEALDSTRLAQPEISEEVISDIFSQSLRRSKFRFY